MKAKEYYLKYNIRCCSGEESEILTAAQEMVEEYIQEAKALLASRGCTTGAAAYAVFKEQNEKWNAMVREFVNRKGSCPFKVNGFIEIAETYYPEVKEWKQQ